MFRSCRAGSCTLSNFSWLTFESWQPMYSAYALSTRHSDYFSLASQLFKTWCAVPQCPFSALPRLSPDSLSPRFPISPNDLQPADKTPLCPADWPIPPRFLQMALSCFITTPWMMTMGMVNLMIHHLHILFKGGKISICHHFPPTIYFRRRFGTSAWI